MFSNALRSMTRQSAFRRLGAVQQHMMNSTSAAQASVLSESNLAARTYILNRPEKLNALNVEMIDTLQSMMQEWDRSDLCRVIIGTGKGRAFCAGGDVAKIVTHASDESQRHLAVDFFKREFELDYTMASLEKPYVAVCDGITMGGGVGLVAHAPFRIATERTKFSMPETKIGYCPDVGSNYFLARMDGQLGTYLAMTGNLLEGRAVFQHGIASHFVPSRRLPTLLSQLASMEDPTEPRINDLIEEHYCDAEGSESTSPFVGDMRRAVDYAFGAATVEDIMASLEELSKGVNSDVRNWAAKTIQELQARSPTSLRVALEAVRRCRQSTLRDVLNMEFGIAAAYCNGASPDFGTGVKAVLVDKIKERPAWTPSQLSEISSEEVRSKFFEPSSPFLSSLPTLAYPESDHWHGKRRERYALPSEHEIEMFAQGSHPTSGAFAVNLQDVIDKFREMKKGKHGVEEKVREVVSRRCETSVDPEMQGALQWKGGS